MAGYYTNGAPGGPAGSLSVGRRIGKDLRELLRNVDRLLNVLVITDDDVEAQNRVTLSNQLPADEHGPVPRVEFHQRSRSRRTLANREYLARRAVQLLKKAGAQKIYRINWPPLILHVQSTMRMGTSASDSVLDANAESRFVKRLFIADNSALANSLGGPNPTLTNQAVATRTAERIFARYFGGDAWINCESPVRSTDRRVTRAVRTRGL
jgi:choline dehydrogenase-like flavoprotein